METKEALVSDAIIPPGDFLKEELEARNMSQKQLAAEMGRPPQMISEVIRGKKGITAATALALEKALGTPAYVWMGLEADYRLALARKAQASRERTA